MYLEDELVEFLEVLPIFGQSVGEIIQPKNLHPRATDPRASRSEDYLLEDTARTFFMLATL